MKAKIQVHREGAQVCASVTRGDKVLHWTETYSLGGEGTAWYEAARWAEAHHVEVRDEDLPAEFVSQRS